MRTPAKLLAALVLGLVAPVIAAPPDHAGGPGGNPNPPGQAAASEGSNGSNGNKPAEPPGKDKKGDEPPGQAKKAPPPPSAPADQDEAQQAVQQLEALPLAKVLRIAQKRGPGRVINARLLRVSGVLLYQLTLLDDEGRSWREYYAAASGNPVVLP